MEGIYANDLEEKEEALSTEPECRPSWQVRVEYSNHTVQDISCYNDYIPERPEELYFFYWSILNRKKNLGGSMCNEIDFSEINPI